MPVRRGLFHRSGVDLVPELSAAPPSSAKIPLRFSLDEEDEEVDDEEDFVLFAELGGDEPS